MSMAWLRLKRRIRGCGAVALGTAVATIIIVAGLSSCSVGASSTTSNPPTSEASTKASRTATTAAARPTFPSAPAATSLSPPGSASLLPSELPSSESAPSESAPSESVSTSASVSVAVSTVGSVPFYGLDVPHARLELAADLTKRTGYRPSVLAAFIRLDTTNTAALVQRISSAGLTPFITLEPWHADGATDRPDPGDSLASIAAGRHDKELLSQARALAGSSDPMYFRFAHEMNASWYPWGIGANGNTSAQFVAAWRHVHRLFAAVPGLSLRWVFSPVELGNPRAHSNLAALYPGDDVVDYLGLTAYSSAAAPAVDVRTTFAPTVTALRSLARKPIVLSEIGAADGPAKASWLRSLGPYLVLHPDVVGFVYFDTTTQSTGATGNYSLSTPVDAQALGATLALLHARRAR